MTELNFDSLELIRIPFKIGDKEYYIQEADGEAGSEYRDAKLTGMKGELDEEGNVINRSFSLAGLNRSELVLLSKCTFTQEGNLVPLNEISKWPDRITQKLVEKVKEISELDQGKRNPTQSSEQKGLQVG